ncbi:ThiF family adenylyltransferase, partial [Pseudomonas syringae]|uniref:ThiF family adenylyltransferase n=1 Tax=Pseudomonas syringae TaxID=317 RepID=UPI0034D670EF
VGGRKVEVMDERIRGIYAVCSVHAVSFFVTVDTFAFCITTDIDFVIECIDCVNAKAALISWCKRRKVQMVTSGGAGGQIDPT